MPFFFPHNEYSSTDQVVKDNAGPFRATLVFDILLLTTTTRPKASFGGDLEESLEYYLAVLFFALSIP